MKYFFVASMPEYLYAFLKTRSRERNYERLRFASLVVIGSLVEVALAHIFCSFLMLISVRIHTSLELMELDKMCFQLIFLSFFVFDFFRLTIQKLLITFLPQKCFLVAYAAWKLAQHCQKQWVTGFLWLLYHLFFWLDNYEGKIAI